MHKVAIVPVLLFLAACGALQVATPQSLSERIAAAYIGVSITNDTATILINAGTVNKDDGRKVLEQTRSAREAIDVASTLDGVAGEDALSRALSILRAAQDKLCGDKPNEPNCALMVRRSRP